MMSRILAALWLSFNAALYGVCSVAAATELVSAVGVRESVSFDYGWRFFLGDPAAPPRPPPQRMLNCTMPETAFPVNVSGKVFEGLQSDGATSAASCAAACCALNNDFATTRCWVWQWHQAANLSRPSCWLGTPKDKRKYSNDATVLGFARPTPNASIPASAPTNSPASDPGFDDSQWAIVDTPHDYLIAGDYDPDTPPAGINSAHVFTSLGPPGGVGQDYRPRNLAFYRKHFNIPSTWEGSTITLYFEGIWRNSKMWLNGATIQSHVGWGSGYTSFSARLDNVTSLKYGNTDADANILAVWVDGRLGSGWWYEGAGIYRKTWLIRTPSLHLARDGIFARSVVDAVGTGNSHRASMVLSATIENTASTATSSSIVFELFDSNGVTAGTATIYQCQIAAAGNYSTPALASCTTTLNLTVPAKLWSPRHPVVYTLRTRLANGDEINTTVGIYSTKWKSDTGFWMNDQHVKIRGFCNHNTFGGVGMMLPDRINLFRAQAIRSMGGNAWRTAHNPPEPGLLDILDRVGVLAMDENRIFTAGTTPASSANPADPLIPNGRYFGHGKQYEMNMGSLVARDRNHPSVVIWSYCNEGGCGPTGGDAFRNITYKYDGTRPTLGNSWGGHSWPGQSSLQYSSTDVAGFSHVSGDVFDGFHKAHPSKPMLASECCSCNPSRVLRSDEAIPSHTSSAIACAASQAQESDGRSFVAGTMVWTGFDYYGESHGWPHVSSPFGAFDLAGFEKSIAHWYRTYWLAAIPKTDAGRPVADFLPDHTCHFSLPWGQVIAPYRDPTHTLGVEVLTDLPKVTLFQDGMPVGNASVNNSALGWASIPWTPAGRNLTAVCQSDDNATTLRHTMLKPGNASAILLTVDAPSRMTGTGTKLMLDGHDVALVRATIVDMDGTTVVDSTANVSFTVVRGPGRVIGQQLPTVLHF